MDLLLAGQRLLLLFPLAQDRSSFLVELGQCRASLEGLKMVALPHQGPHTQGGDRLPARMLRLMREFPPRPHFQLKVTPPCCSALRLSQIQTPVLLYRYKDISRHQQVEF